MYCDTRIGSVPVWYIDPPDDAGMRVPNRLLDCVVFLFSCPKQRGTHRYGMDLEGTGFLLAYEPRETHYAPFLYLVTARHVARKLTGDRWAIRINREDGTASTEVMKGAGTRWYPHPDRSVDLSVAPISLPSCNFKVRPLRSFDCYREPDIAAHKELARVGIGDEVFLVGLFGFMTGTKRNLPIVRTGTIAMMPPERIPLGGNRSMEGYLVEARSIGGISGSPVFVRETIQPDHFKNVNRPIGTRREEPSLALGERCWLLGVMRGHWDIPPEQRNKPVPRAVQCGGVNVGIAIVIPAEKIRETLNRPDLVRLRQREEQQERRRRGLAIED